MAIDTESRRRSVQSLHLGALRPVADGAVNEGDRAHVAWLYSGLDYDSPVAAADGGWFRTLLTYIRRRLAA